MPFHAFQDILKHLRGKILLINQDREILGFNYSVLTLLGRPTDQATVREGTDETTTTAKQSEPSVCMIHPHKCAIAERDVSYVGAQKVLGLHENVPIYCSRCVIKSFPPSCVT